MSKSIIHTQYRLKIGNPLRIYGILTVFAGILLLILSYTIFSNIGSQSEWFSKTEEVVRMLDQAQGRLSYGLHLIFSFIFGLVSLFMGLSYTFGGIKYVGKIYLPSKVPDNFQDTDSLHNSLTKREILTYSSAPTASMKFIRSFFSDSADFLPPSFRPIISENSGYFSLAFFPVFLIIGIYFFQDALANLLQLTNINIPFPYFWLMVVIIITGIRLFTTYLLIPKEAPSSSFERTHQPLGGAGHPEILLSEIELKAEEYRYKDIPNRIYKRSDVELQSDDTGDSGKIKGGILFETQPVPLEQQHRAPGYIFLFTGTLFVLIGIYMLGYIPYNLELSTFAEFSMAYLPSVFLHIVVGWVFLRNGRRFINYAKRILSRITYQSDLFSIDFGGTFYKSEIGAGMSRDDSLRSTSKAIRSELVVKYHCATAISESVAFGKRELLETKVTNNLKERVTGLKERLEEHHNRGAKLVGIDMEGSKAISDIAQANISLKAAKSASSSKAKKTGQLPPGFQQDSPRISENSSENKVCPDCAETIKLKARKCRYCGYRFDENSTEE